MKANTLLNANLASQSQGRPRLLRLIFSILITLLPQSSPAQEADKRAATQQRFAVMQSKTTPSEDRLRALHLAFGAKESLSSGEKVEFIGATTAIARDRSENSRLRADSIRITGDVGMALLRENILTPAEVSERCSFMLGIAADEGEPARIRHNSIIALGNLHMAEAVPVVRKLLADKANHNRPEITRSACLVMAELGAPDAVETVGAVLSQTTNSAVFGSAAYALGRANSLQALSVLLSNRSRLGDNLSVDNAVEAMQEQVFQALEHPTQQTQDAIKATRSLWRKEQKERYTPLLLEIIKSKRISVSARQEALSRLLEDAATLPLAEEKQRLAIILPLVEGDNVFTEQTALINQKLAARVLPPTSIEPPSAK
jgi:hypothetical protein